MATHVRVTGLLTNVSARQNGESEGRSWSRQTATVLVGGVSTTEVTFDPSKADAAILNAITNVYQPIDLLVDCGVFNNRLSLRVVDLWDNDRAEGINELVSTGAGAGKAA